MAVNYQQYFDSVINELDTQPDLHFYKADQFPVLSPVYWLKSHFAVGAYSPLARLSGMLTAHMSQIAPHHGFNWHPHRGLEIYTYVIDGTLYHEDTTGGKGNITAGEVQRMFSGDYIEHKELNRTPDYTRVIQIWFLVEDKHRHLPPHYEQVPLKQMPSQQHGEGVVRSIIGPAGATDSHVNARLTSTTITPGGQSEVILPEENEDLFLYVVNGQGQLQAPQNELDTAVSLYDVVLARPEAEAPVFTAGDEPLTYLSFYLPKFLS